MKSLAQLMDLTGRVALVTGAVGQLGRVFCETLAELHAAVVILDLEEDACNALASSIADTFGVKTKGLAVDLAVEKQVRAVPQPILQEFGRLDILVNSAAMAGISGEGGWGVPFADQSSVAWRRALEVNLTAPFVLVQQCADALKESGHGSVINLGSIYGVVGPDFRLYEGTGTGNPAAYAASKGGLVQLTRWLATAMAPHVRVNAISPGGVWAAQEEPFYSRYLERVPTKRMAVEEDLKGALAFLASDLSAYVTGQNLLVDGGWTTW